MCSIWWLQSYWKWILHSVINVLRPYVVTFYMSTGWGCTFPRIPFIVFPVGNNIYGGTHKWQEWSHSCLSFRYVVTCRLTHWSRTTSQPATSPSPDSLQLLWLPGLRIVSSRLGNSPIFSKSEVARTDMSSKLFSWAQTHACDFIPVLVFVSIFPSSLPAWQTLSSSIKISSRGKL